MSHPPGNNEFELYDAEELRHLLADRDKLTKLYHGMLVKEIYPLIIDPAGGFVA